MTSYMLLLFSFLFSAPAPKGEVHKTIYEFQAEALDGSTINFADFKGKKILIVNTASKCGFTPQYKGLEELYETHKDNLVIIGFPANNFGKQEPGNNGDIAAFCEKNYGVTFPMAAKISVKGTEMAPIYHWLTKKEFNNYKNSSVKWNFQKYLIDEQGKLVGVFGSTVKPNSKKILDAINN